MARTRGSIGVKTRLKQPANDAEAARRAAAAYLQARSKLSGVNMVQLHAQMHEVACVEQLVEFVHDTTLPPALRRDCAKDVLHYARGTPKIWLHDGASVDVRAPSPRDPAHRKVADDIREVKDISALYQELNALVSAGVHTSDWPDAVKALVDAAQLEHYNVVPHTVN